jgi:hypothetical protein
MSDAEEAPDTAAASLGNVEGCRLVVSAVAGPAGTAVGHSRRERDYYSCMKGAVAIALNLRDLQGIVRLFPLLCFFGCHKDLAVRAACRHWGPRKMVRRPHYQS